MKSAVWSSLLPCVFLSMAVDSAAQAPVGALTIDERQSDQWGWAVDYETAAAAQERALGECGPGCSVVLTFGRCAAYAADQDADSTAVGWAEAYASADDARQAALAECRSRGGGSGCIVRAWAATARCRGGAESGLGGPASDPAGSDGRGVRPWRCGRPVRSSDARGDTAVAVVTRCAVDGYLDGASAEALRSVGGAGPTVVTAASSSPPAVPAAQQSSPAASPAASAELLFWQSVMNSTNPAEFEAYLRRFPNGLFSELAQARVVALRAPASAAPAATGTRVGRAGSPGATGSRVSGAPAPGFGTAVGGDVRQGPGEIFRDCAECPEMVVMPGGEVALGRHEVTVGEYRVFSLATGVGVGGGCTTWTDVGDSWRDPGFPQADRHPVTCVSWDDAQAYVSWLSRRRVRRTACRPRRNGNVRLSARSPDATVRARRPGDVPVGSYSSNSNGLSDMVGNLWEWTEDCWEGDCNRRVQRGGAWNSRGERLGSGARNTWWGTDSRFASYGFRVAKTLPRTDRVR